MFKVFLKELKIVGQFRNSFLLLKYRNKQENIKCLLLIDQHGLSERCIFDTFLKNVSNYCMINRYNINIKISSKICKIFEKSLERINKQFGFNLYLDNKNKVLFIKYFWALENYCYSTKEILLILLKVTKTKIFSNMKIETLLKTKKLINYLKEISCKSALKLNTKLDKKEIEKHVHCWVNTDNPYECIHGRRIIQTIRL